MNTIELSFEDSSVFQIVEEKEIRSFILAVCKVLNLNNCEFSVSFVDSQKMREINKEFRSIDDATDILSFAVEDSEDGFDFIVPKNHKRNIGDMLLCIDVLKQNAQTFDVPQKQELQRLLIHGLLHLTGYNHLTNDMSEPMLIKQEQILKQLIQIFD